MSENDATLHMVFVLACIMAVGFFAFTAWAMPVVVAWQRDHPDLVAIAATLVLGSFCLPFGWPIAMIWALKTFDRR